MWVLHHNYLSDLLHRSGSDLGTLLEKGSRWPTNMEVFNCDFKCTVQINMSVVMSKTKTETWDLWFEMNNSEEI
jgi:hypothetical protein